MINLKSSEEIQLRGLIDQLSSHGDPFIITTSLMSGALPSVERFGSNIKLDILSLIPRGKEKEAFSSLMDFDI